MCISARASAFHFSKLTFVVCPFFSYLVFALFFGSVFFFFLVPMQIDVEYLHIRSFNVSLVRCNAKSFAKRNWEREKGNKNVLNGLNGNKSMKFIFIICTPFTNYHISLARILARKYVAFDLIWSRHSF